MCTKNAIKIDMRIFCLLTIFFFFTLNWRVENRSGCDFIFYYIKEVLKNVK